MSDIFSVSRTSLESFRAKSGEILAATLSRALSEKEEVSQHGEEARRIVGSGLDFTLRMIDAAMAAGESAILDDELKWALVRLPHDGVSMEQVLSRLGMLKAAVLELLPPTAAAEVSAVIAWMEGRLRELASVPQA